MKTVIPFKLHIDEAALREMATDFPHQDPQPHQPANTGFTGFEALDNRVFKLSIKSTKRVVPVAAVNRLLAEKIAAWTDTAGYPPGRKATRELKEQVIDELLPRAFLADSLHTVYLVDDLVMFSSKLALEFFTDALRRTTYDPIAGCSTPMYSVFADRPDAASVWPVILTEWATDEPPEPFSLGDHLKAKGEESSVSFQSPSILSDFPKVANPERHVSELKLLSDTVSFVLTDTFILKSVKLAPEYREGDLLTARELARTVSQLIEVMS